MVKIGILTTKEHADKTWIASITSRLRERGLEYVELDVSNLSFDPCADTRLDEVSLLVNRVSDCGSGDLLIAKFTMGYLQAAELRGMDVMNGARAYSVGMAKLCHHAVLSACGLKCPKSVVVRDHEQLLAAAQGLEAPLLLKPNMAGFGAGIVPFSSREDVTRAVADAAASTSAASAAPPEATDGPREAASDKLSFGPDGIALLQEYKQAMSGEVCRVWVLGKRIQCAVRARLQPLVGPPQDFNGCVCTLQKKKQADVTAFAPSEAVQNEVLSIMQACHAEVGSVEYLIEGETGQRYYFDVNMLSTLPDPSGVAQAEAVWGPGYDPWTELVDYIQRRSAKDES